MTLENKVFKMDNRIHWVLSKAILIIFLPDPFKFHYPPKIFDQNHFTYKILIERFQRFYLGEPKKPSEYEVRELPLISLLTAKDAWVRARVKKELQKVQR